MNPEEYAQLFRLGETHWWFIGTRDILFSSVRFDKKDGNLILDAGCGSGLMTRRFSCAGQVYGIDKSLEALKHCSSLGIKRLCQGDTLALPFKTSAFDLVVAADLLEHCEDDGAVLREFHRVIADNGRLLVSVPAYKALWSSHDVSLHHKRRYSKRELIAKMLDSGYFIQRASYFNTTLFPLVAMIRLTLGKLPNRSASIKYHEDRRLLNKILLAVMRFERRLLQRLDLPFGLSLMVVACKTREQTR
ncbi:MAG: class I SAM-dependent methyltransferase [Candidatus Abyssobacteria bacterium SURF_5]|uniref:Class I SAM-dependent methyltransferase n=1 Tax=Abyssobacteria bacterium (strain SURF_5) TaxID=2093360 RepID=A0A3A4NKM4_ABYX5|nr:MAG: class I SAM-dependent methyltransferase [Candidatus Abyssubacteria bacterium SURF_5]